MRMYLMFVYTENVYFMFVTFYNTKTHELLL